MRVVIYTKGNGWMIKPMAMGATSTPTDQSTRGNGKMIVNKGMELKHGLTEHATKENSIKAKNRGRGKLSIVMVLAMRESSLKMLCMDLVYISGGTVKSIEENGRTIRCMVREG